MTEFNFADISFVQITSTSIIHILNSDHVGIKFTIKPDGVPGKYEVNCYAFDCEQLLHLASVLMGHIRGKFEDRQIPEHLFHLANLLIHPEKYDHRGELIRWPHPPQQPQPEDEPLVVPAAPNGMAPPPE
jgi:hypothetical protein